MVKFGCRHLPYTQKSYFMILFCFGKHDNNVLLNCQGWPQTPGNWKPPASGSRMLTSQVCTAMPNHIAGASLWDDLGQHPPNTAALSLNQGHSVSCKQKGSKHLVSGFLFSKPTISPAPTQRRLASVYSLSRAFVSITKIPD